MPGLFGDTNDGSGIAGILGGLGATLFPGVRQYQLQQQNANTVNQIAPGMGQLITTDPQAANTAIGQRNLQMTIDALTPQFGRERAIYFALHPEVINESAKPMNVPEGGSVYTPLDLLRGGGNAQPPAIASQAPPSNGVAPSGGVPGAQFTNTNGVIQQPALLNLVKQGLLGKDVQTQLGGAMGSRTNKSNYQALLNQVMANPRQFGIDSDPISQEDLVQRQAQFPAYEDALKKNAEVSSRMQLAQNEARQVLPLFKQAITKLGPTDYPIFNRVNQEWQAQTGNPASAEAASYMNALINTYARGVAPSGGQGGGSSVNATEHLREVVNPYWSKGQLEAGANAVMKELNIANNAIKANNNEINVRYGFGKDPSQASAPQGGGSWLDQARAAIKAGVSREEVERRLAEHGFHAKGL